MALWSMFIYIINPLQELYRGALLCFPKLFGFAVTLLAGFRVQHLLSPTSPEQVHLLRCLCSKAWSSELTHVWQWRYSPGTSVWLWVQTPALKQFVWGTNKAFLEGIAVAEALLSAWSSSCLRSWLPHGSDRWFPHGSGRSFPSQLRPIVPSWLRLLLPLMASAPRAASSSPIIHHSLPVHLPHSFWCKGNPSLN